MSKFKLLKESLPVGDDESVAPAGTLGAIVEIFNDGEAYLCFRNAPRSIKIYYLQHITP